MTTIAVVFFLLALAGPLIYFFVGMVYNFVWITSWVVYWVWFPIDWAINRRPRHRARRGLDY